MSFDDVTKKLTSSVYTNDQFHEDMEQIWTNACIYNPQGTFINDLAKRLQKKA